MSAPVTAPRDAPVQAPVSVGAPLWRRTFGELLGTGLLVATVVGSGIAAANLSPDDVGLAVLLYPTRPDAPGRS